MATMKFSARRLIIAGGFAVAVAAAPAIAFVATPTPAATPLAQCPGGEEEDLYTRSAFRTWCPTAGEPYQAIGGNPDLPAVNLPGGGGSHSLHRPQLRPVHRPGRGGATGTGGDAGVDGWQQPDGHRFRRQRRLDPGGHSLQERPRIYGGVMAAKSDPAEIGDVEPLADSTARQARRVVAAYATDADECRVFLSMLGIGPAKLEA